MVPAPLGSCPVTNTQFRPLDVVGQKRHLGTIRGSLDTAGRCASAVSGQVIPQDPLGDPMDHSLLHPWDFPGNSTGVGCHSLLSLLV